MNKVLKEVLTSVKIWIFIIFLLISIFSINYKFDTSGVTINKVIDRDLGISSPDETAPLTQRELILVANSQKVEDMDHFYSIIKDLKNESLILETNKGNVLTYESLSYNENVTLEEMIGLSLVESTNSNLRFGIDLKGGIRAVLKPDKHLKADEMTLMIDSLDQRLNAFGLSNVVIRTLEGQYILIEMAGMSESEFKEIILSEGAFEAKIGNVTVFEGGDDIAGVCKVSSCAGIDPYSGCQEYADGWGCRFRFEIYKTPKAAQKFHETIQNIPTESSSGESYLTQDLELYLDGNLQDRLKIAGSLKSAPQTTIVISGSGTGASMAIAQEDALDNMKKLQVILESGSLPAKLNIESLDIITADLGELFLKNSMLLGIVAVVIVSILVFIFYKKFALSGFIILTVLSEILIVLGFAALLKWDLDLVAIAGIIISVGTGVDDQLIITDEAMGKSQGSLKKEYSIKKRLANAFFIMFGAYFTTVVAMIPLFRGVQLLRGFAFTTILGVTIGVLITRPAYAKFIEIYLKNTKDKK
ncbi:MAG: MMPL family transporter [Candidatus Nanoarchaeia archaeon]|nr:MMPL family transporter [Candidatus Nanoarchaeia archaeon]